MYQQTGEVNINIEQSISGSLTAAYETNSNNDGIFSSAIRKKGSKVLFIKVQTLFLGF